MSDENSRTIDAYENSVGEYIAGTPQGVEGGMKLWLDQTVEGLPLDAQILEIGSAFGRDAEYLQSKGYTVQCSDATHNFVELLRHKGFDAKDLNIITDELDSTYDYILANAVLLHFTTPEVERVLRKVHSALKPLGRFAFSVVKGEGEAWTEGKLGRPRYFNYWNEHDLSAVLNSVGYKAVELTIGGSKDDREWLQFIAYK